MHHLSHRTVCNCAGVRAKHLLYVAFAAVILLGVRHSVQLDSTNLREETQSISTGVNNDDPRINGSIVDPISTNTSSDNAKTNRNIGDPSINGNFEDPTIKSSIGEPTTSGSVGDPAINGGISDPTIKSSIGEPTTSGSIDDPAINGGISDPTIKSSIGEPTTSGSVSDPAINGGISDPTIKSSIGEITTNGGISDPAINGGISDPTIKSSIGEPTTSGSVSDPAINGGISDPTIKSSIGEPTTSGSVSDPAINGGISDPTIKSSIGEPTTSGSVSDPAINGGISDPTIKSSIGEPTTSGSIDDPVSNNLSSNDYEFYTFAPRPFYRRERLLFYTEFSDYLSRVDRFYYDFIEAARTHPLLDVFIFGPDFTGWNKQLSATENINERFGTTPMSVVYAHYRHPGEYSRGLMIHELGDCDREYCREHMNPFANVILFRYAHEAVDMFANSADGSRYPRFAKPEDPHLIAHVPDCANAKVFFPPNDMSRRKNSIVVYGATGGINPLRVKVAGYIWEGKIPGGSRFHHPGYDQLGIINGLEAEGKLNLSDARIDPYMDTEQNRVLQNLLNRNQREMAEHMRDTWICVFDSTTMRKTIRKFMEAMLSGCAVASDIPLDFPLEYSHLIIELKHQWSVERINATLQAHLSDKPALMKRIDSGLKFARKTYPCAKKVDAVLEVADGCRYRNWGGFVFPQSFRVDCTLYDQNPGFHSLHPWCNDTAAIAAGGHRLL